MWTSVYYWSVVLFFQARCHSATICWTQCVDWWCWKTSSHCTQSKVKLMYGFCRSCYSAQNIMRILWLWEAWSRVSEHLCECVLVSSDCFVSMATGSYFWGTVLLSSLGTLPRATYDMSLHFCSQRVWRSEPPFCCFPKIIRKQRYIWRYFVYSTTRILCLWWFV